MSPTCNTQTAGFDSVLFMLYAKTTCVESPYCDAKSVKPWTERVPLKVASTCPLRKR